MSLLKGLEISESKFSALERTKRIDAEYFRPDFVKSAATLATLKNTYAVNDLAGISDGNHFSISDDFIDAGIPYYRGQDVVGNFFIEHAAPVLISLETFHKPHMTRSHLQQGDVLLSIVGTIGELSLVSAPTQATCSCKLAILRPHEISPEYLAIFLRCSFGSKQVQRIMRGAIQMSVLLEDMDQLFIPRFSPKFETAITKQVQAAHIRFNDAASGSSQAEQTLLRALGLEGWEPPEPLTYTRRASEAHTAERIDAEYFAPRVAQLLAKLSADGLTIRDVAPARHEVFDPKAPKARDIPAQGNALGRATTHGEALLRSREANGRNKNVSRAHDGLSRPDGALSSSAPEPRALPWAGMFQAVGLHDSTPDADTFNYIEIGGLRSDGTATSEATPTDEAPSRANQRVHAGDILTSTVRPIRRLSAIVAPEQHGHVCSSGFVVLEPKAIAPEVLLTYLRLPIVCELMDLHTSASLYPAISERDLLKLPIPRIPAAAAKSIIENIQSAHAARAEAQSLLARAKRAVEVAIEEGEENALNDLAS